jgi:ATP-dependent protease ClpP protease subunit
VVGTIDLGLAPYTSRVIREAESIGAAALILRINTPGGCVDAAIQRRDALLDAKLDTIAFIGKEAYSAGALIALAAKQIASRSICPRTIDPSPLSAGSLSTTKTRRSRGVSHSPSKDGSI